jgi:protocatechuate 3,4-dioxygenase beta subunit
MQAAARHIQLVVMPQGMSKRSLNTTQYRPKTDLILWRLHIVFVINNSYQPHMLLKPESPSSQNNNIGEQSSSSSAISITGADRDLVRYSILTATLCHVSQI